MSDFKASDFFISKTFIVGIYSYVIVSLRDDMWEEPEHGSAFAVNKLIKALPFKNIGECREGVFECDATANEMEKLLLQAGFVYSPALDSYIRDLADEIADV